MVTVRPVKVDGETAIGITTELPKTRVLALATEKGYVMCGIINIPELDRIHPERRIVAARVVGVREVEDLLEAEVVEATQEAKRLGIKEGMSGKDALRKMF
ncbi:MAG: DUF1805 domain-containing protein [Candidatus Rokubacteria bacterium]|nr:DUF1805 domain-containing protein [Candidatus Rokubacteria bacterium]